MAQDCRTGNSEYVFSLEARDEFTRARCAGLPVPFANLMVHRTPFGAVRWAMVIRMSQPVSGKNKGEQ